MIGIVKFVNEEKGFGFIKTDEADFYFKCKDAIGISKGDTVQFEIKTVTRGQQAVNIALINSSSNPKMIRINDERIPLNKIQSYDFVTFEIEYIKEVIIRRTPIAIGILDVAIYLASEGKSRWGKVEDKLIKEKIYFKTLILEMKNGVVIRFYSDTTPDKVIDIHRNQRNKHNGKFEDDETFKIMNKLEFTNRDIYEIASKLDKTFGII